jgi:hypothetical protein
MNRFAAATRQTYAKGLKLNLDAVRVQLQGVEGIDDTIAALAALPGRAQTNLYRRAIRPGLMAVAKEARALVHNIPIRSGMESRESKRDEDGSLRDEVARAIKVRVGIKPKKGVYGNVAVRYPKRGKNVNKIPPGRKAQLAHLIEFGWTLKVAYRGKPRSQPLEIEGSEFMTSAFERVAPRARRLVQQAIVALARDPSIGKKQFSKAMEAVL